MTTVDPATAPLVDRAPAPRDESPRRSVDEAVRLTSARGGLVFLRGEGPDGVLLSATAEPLPADRLARWQATLRDPRKLDGILVKAMVSSRPVVTDDYLEDRSFVPGRTEAAAVRQLGIRAMVAVPIVIDAVSAGVLAVYSDRPAAFDEARVTLLRALADHVAGTVANERLIGELGRSRMELARRAENERSLREIAARFAAITDPADLLQYVVDEANRLVDGDGAVLDVLQPGTRILAWAYDSGLSDRFGPEDIGDYTLPIGVGLTGRAVEQRTVLVAGDDLVAEFPRSAESDHFFAVTGFRSMIAAPIGDDARPLGALEVYSTRPDAFDPDDAALVGALADHAAVALTTARRMADLTESQAELAHRSEVERSLLGIAARISAIREPGSVVQQTVDEAARLLGADGARIDLIEPSLRLLRGAYMSGGVHPSEEEWPDTPDETLDTGVSGLAVAQNRTFLTGDYLADDRFRHGSGSDVYIRSQAIRSVMAAPLVGEDGPFGALTVFSTRSSAFDEADAGVLESIANHAAIALTNARLIEALDRSRGEVARRADAEQSLREIAARISSIRAPAEVIQHAVDESVRLLRADQARIELIDAATDQLRVAYMSSRDRRTPPDRRAGAGRPGGTGVGGRVVATGERYSTGDYLLDTGFEHDAAEDVYVAAVGLRSVLSVPLSGEDGTIGVLSVGSSTPDAFDAFDAELLDALATQVSVAIATARLIEALDGSRQDVARRAETERALREIAARITALHDPATILEQAAAEAGRLLDAEGATIDLLTPVGSGSGFWFAVGVAQNDVNAPALMDVETAVGVGISGRALAEGRPIATGDYLTDPTFNHEPSRDAFIASEGIHSVMAAPLATDAGPVGVLNVHALRRDAFGPDELRIIGTIADLATIAVTNAGLIERLNRSAADVARRADMEHALREIATSLVGTRDPETVLHLVVDEAIRILRGHGALLDLVVAERGTLRTTYDAGLSQRVGGERVREQELPIGQGISGRAVAERRVIVTGDYLADESIEHEAEADDFIRRAGIRSLVAAPLLGDDEVLGALEVFSERPDAFGPDEIAILEAFAGQAALALASARLWGRLEASEERHRRLATTSPDLIWSASPDGVFTFISEASRELLGLTPDELVGRHFATVVAPVSIPRAMDRWTRILAQPTQRQLVPLDLVRSDGTVVPTEITAVGVVVDGRLVGVHGSTRDVRDRNRLELELRRQAAEIAAGEERAHLARELHDSVTQALFSMTLITRSVEILVERDPVAAVARLETLRELQRDALAEMRALIFELRPGSLERDGLAQALRTHAAAVEGRTGLSIVVDCLDPTDRLPLQTEDVLYRIGQEALHNVVKHAGATRARLTIARSDGAVELSVEDDGSGFDPTSVGSGHLGLDGMRVRAERAGGRLEVEAAPGRGTVVRAILPTETAVTSG